MFIVGYKHTLEQKPILILKLARTPREETRNWNKRQRSVLVAELLVLASNQGLSQTENSRDKQFCEVGGTL